jgi:dynein heavy chain
LNDEPEVFGMHSNANITSGINDTNEMLQKVLELQPQTSDGTAGSTDNLIMNKCREIRESLPEKFDIDMAAKKFEIKYVESMNTVLQQELIRYNNLLVTIKTSLVQLTKAIEGSILMSTELEMMYNRMYLYQVPEIWTKQAYPSLKPLTPWIDDFLKRLQFMQDWLDRGQPAVFWLSGFFFTQSFLTGTLQNYARRVTTA